MRNEVNRIRQDDVRVPVERPNLFNPEEIPPPDYDNYEARNDVLHRRPRSIVREDLRDHPIGDRRNDRYDYSLSGGSISGSSVGVPQRTIITPFRVGICYKLMKIFVSEQLSLLAGVR